MTDGARSSVDPQAAEPAEPAETGEPAEPAETRPLKAAPAPRTGVLHRIRRVRRRWLVLVAVVLVLIVGILAATLRLFVFPKTGTLTKADAIVMFDGIGGRKDATYALASRGYAPVVAISTQNMTFCQRTLPTISGVQVFCFTPTPATTQGEAEATERLAAEHGWNKVIVVVGRAQETRARVRVERCYGGQLEVTGVSPGRDNWPKTIVYEWGALIKALVFQRSC